MQAVSRLLVFALALAVSAGSALAATQVTRFVVGAGGETATSAHHHGTGTLGQTVAGSASSSGYAVQSGFWGGGSAVTGVADDTPSRLSCRLYQNLPNPAHSRTTIRFDLPRDTVAALRIYNLRGEPVRTLVDGPQSAGEKRLDWNGRDDRGKPVAAGVYLYVLTTAERRFTRKLTMMRP